MTIPKPHTTTLVYAVIAVIVLILLYHFFVRKG